MGGFTAIQFQPHIVYPLRSDEDFTQRLNKEHHHKSHQNTLGILETVGVKMVTQLPICAMHTVDMGIMKKILKIILIEGGSRTVKFTSIGLIKLGSLYKSLRKQSILEMERYPIDLVKNTIGLKSNECRCILFYYGMIMFKPLMPKEMYEHFLCLCVAIRLLADPTSNARISTEIITKVC